MRDSGRKGPRAAAALVRLLLAPANACRLLDALDEEYAVHQLPARTRLGAHAWYWRQAVLSIAALARAQRASAPRDRFRLAGITQDLKYARRRLARERTYTVWAAATLALGIGATTAIFSVVQGVLLRALPYDGADRIVRAWAHADDGSITDFSFRVVEYTALREQSALFEAVGAEFPESFTLLGGDADPVRVQGRRISAEFFAVFGVEPALGRAFTVEEVDAGDRLVTIATHGFWMRHLGGDPEAVGRTLDLSGAPFTLVGVLPADYRHVSGQDAELFIPYSIGTSGWIARWLYPYVRLRPDVTVDQAAAGVTATMRAVAEQDNRSKGWHATVEGLHAMVVGDVRPTVWATFGMVGLVLLLACVNVANLTLARQTTHAPAVNVRRALGASTGRLFQQSFIESALLAGIGGALGVSLGYAAVRILVANAPASIPRITEIGMEPAVLVFAVLVTFSTMLLFGLGPSVRSARGSSAGLVRRTRAGTVGRGVVRLLAGLVVVEVALALVLLAGAGLTARSMHNLKAEDLGFERAGALTFRVALPAVRYRGAVEVDRFYTRLREDLGTMPGVRAVGVGSDLPVSGQGAVASATTEDRVSRSVDPITVLQRRAGPGLFAALSTPIVEGREFDGSEPIDGPRVTVISESLARSLFPGETAVGRRVAFGSSPAQDDWMTVLGVVADVRFERVESANAPQLYQAHAQSPVRDMAVVVRTSADPSASLEGAREIVHAIDPQVPVYAAGTLGGLVDDALAARRFTMSLFTIFALVALVLSVAGIYGVLAFYVSRRSREIGIRIALGANGGSVIRHILMLGAAPLAIGIISGIALTAGASRAIETLLYGISALDIPTLAAVSAGLAAVALLACLAPALRAAALDPMTSLRED